MNAPRHRRQPLAPTALTALGAALCLYAMRSLADLPVVDQSQARALIVRNTEGGKVVALAADELRDHIEAMTGVKLEVVSAAAWDRDSGATALIVGGGALLAEIGVDTGDLPREGFRIITKPERRVVVLAGRDRGNPLGTAASYRIAQEFGSLYAVYALLEHWGVRWLFPGKLGTIVPKTATLTAPVLDKTDGPDFSMRNHWIQAVTPDGITATRADLSGDDAAKRAAAREAHLWALRNRAGNSENTYRGGHHSPRWWDLWSETHPEYLGLYRGQRGIRRSPPGGVPDKLMSRSKICAGNPKAAEAVADLAIRAFRASSNTLVYSICEQDGSPGFCECPLCAALDAPAAGETAATVPLTDRYVVFWNRVAARVATEFPDRYLGIYLYSRYNELPRRERALHPMLKAIFVANGQVEPDRLKQRMAGWRALTPNRLSLYTHPMFAAWPVQDFSGAAFPALTLDNVREGIRFCREQGVLGFIGDAGHFAANSVGSHGVLAYAYARWMWDADCSSEAILDDFTRHAFGRAAETMRSFFAAIERRQNAHPRVDGREAWLEHHLQVFTPAFVSELTTLLDQATGTADTDDNRRRVDIFQRNLVYTAAELDLERAWRRFEAGNAKIEPVLEAYRHCEKVYGGLPAETRPQSPMFRNGDAARAAVLSAHFDIVSVLRHEGWQMRADPYDEGMIGTWQAPGDGGDWRPVAWSGYDLQGLWCSDVRVWYRTRFELPAGLASDRLRLGFRVTNTSADLFLNGQRIGQQVLDEGAFKEPELDGGGNLVASRALNEYGSFVYDISRQVRPGETNTLAARVWGYTDRGVACQTTWLLSER